MEANEAMELKEHGEHAGHDASLRPATFTMSFLAILVALTTVLGHRTHTEAVLVQNRSTDEWNLYQAKKIRQTDTALATDLLSAMALRDEAAAKKLAESYKAHQEKWNEDLAEEQKKATELQDEVGLIERRASRYDLGEALLEIALVITSITLLTRKQLFMYFGWICGLAGVICAASVLLIH
ncbi:MAG TPA: DUF4337 domain-containing protein [Acidisarcina sp.]|nr:DUF4337 domain-containing protein [Acidisarcina sp.]